jgi:hypothetical protein
MYFAHHIGELKPHVLLGFEWAIHEGFNRTHRALYLPERPHEQSTAIGSPKATKIGRVGGDIMVALFVLCETGHRHPASSGAWWPPGSLLARRVGAASHLCDAAWKLSRSNWRFLDDGTGTPRRARRGARHNERQPAVPSRRILP